MRYDNKPQLGYFLDFNLWKNALKLLDYQLKLKLTNRHFYTFSMFYYERLGSRTDHIKKKKYFKRKVTNNLFYGLSREFAPIPYTIPKSNLGLRNYKFLSYSMRVLYYSVGLYLLKLSQDFVDEYIRRNDQIHTDYGGKLRFDPKTEQLQLKYNSIWYRPHYKRFRKRVRNEVKGDTDNKLVIHLDIQNYYDEISIPTLLSLLQEYIKPSIQKELRFDSIAQQQIISFFEFVAGGKLGIPQSDNSIISSYIGHLYMIFGDLFLDEELQKDNQIVEAYSVIRYVDDTFVSITFKEETGIRERETYINSLAFRIADKLFNKLGLRFNTKTKLFWLNNPEDKEGLLRRLKKVSPGYEIADDEDKEDPNAKIERIFRQLEDLKKEPIDSTFKQRNALDEEILKEVYSDVVIQLLKKPDHKKRLNQVFYDFNFDLVNAQPLPILILLLKDDEAAKAFREFLLSKEYLTSRDVDLILNFLCQTDFKCHALIESLGKSEQMGQIIDLYNTKVPFKRPGYYELKNKQALRLRKMPNVIEQIKLRILSERNHDYSVALNHLLNEIHAICYQLDNRKIDEKRYDATKVLEFLVIEDVPNNIYFKIRNLFDRRNKSPVSHADPIAWSVDEADYLGYRESVAACLSYLLG